MNELPRMATRTEEAETIRRALTLYLFEYYPTQGYSCRLCNGYGNVDEYEKKVFYTTHDEMAKHLFKYHLVTKKRKRIDMTTIELFVPPPKIQPV